MFRQFKRILIRVAVLLGTAILLFDVGHVFHLQPPAAPDVHTLRSASDQQWPYADAHWFYTASQGTTIMPHAWFMALEQPELRIVTTPPLLHEPGYLRRFGFLYEDAKSTSPDLPIGFAAESNFRDLHNGGKDIGKVVGLTCSACHTGQVNYRGQGIRIDGLPGSVDLGLFQKAVGRALALTLYVPTRFDRFAARVLDGNNTDENRRQLKAEFRKFVESRLHAKLYADSRRLYDMKAGNGRTDALALIGNRTFQDLDNPENLEVTNAPVNFPPLWDAPWFDWVQYNASIGPPMVRNIGEALGVGALVVTNPKAGQLYDSTVNVQNLHEIEQSLAGDQPLKGLRAPKWPEDMLGKLDPELNKEGEALYAARCQHCHPLLSQFQESLAGQGDPGLWVQPDEPEYAGTKLMRLPVINLRRIGTDPAQALNMHRRVVQTPEGTLSEGEALFRVTWGVRELKYEALKLTDEQRQKYDSDRVSIKGQPNAAQKRQIIADNLGYRARPLDGVWATAPYLHNGSVPTLYDLLLPVARRPKSFYAGGREFDPDKVGFHSDRRHGLFLLDTTIAGNFNTGHEYRNLMLDELETSDPELIAKRLLEGTEEERWARVLRLPLSEFGALGEAGRHDHIRKASADAIRDPKRAMHMPPGVLGAELTEGERHALIAYLKSL